MCPCDDFMCPCDDYHYYFACCRFIEPEGLFKEALQLLRNNPTECLTWMTDKGKTQVDTKLLYMQLMNAVEASIRRVALSGNRLFKVHTIASKEAWHNKERWRCHRCVLFLLRYYLKSENFGKCP